MFCVRATNEQINNIPSKCRVIIIIIPIITDTFNNPFNNTNTSLRFNTFAHPVCAKESLKFKKCQNSLKKTTTNELTPSRLNFGVEGSSYCIQLTVGETRNTITFHSSSNLLRAPNPLLLPPAVKTSSRMPCSMFPHLEC